MKNTEQFIFDAAEGIRSTVELLMEIRKDSFLVDKIPEKDFENLVDELYLLNDNMNLTKHSMLFIQEIIISRLLKEYNKDHSDCSIHINKGVFNDYSNFDELDFEYFLTLYKIIDKVNNELFINSNSYIYEKIQFKDMDSIINDIKNNDFKNKDDIEKYISNKSICILNSYL